MNEQVAPNVQIQRKPDKTQGFIFLMYIISLSFLTSLKSLVNVLMISAFCRLSNISLLTTPKQTAIKNPYNSVVKFDRCSVADNCPSKNRKDNLFNFDPCPYSGGRS